jgi:hypothetical protein
MSMTIASTFLPATAGPGPDDPARARRRASRTRGFRRAHRGRGLDLSAVRLEYIKYLEAASTATDIAFAVKLLTGSGTPGQQGELRIVLMTAV